MNEKYNTLSLVELKAIVKAQGIKNTSAMRKAQLIQILCDLEEAQKTQPEDGENQPKSEQKSDTIENAASSKKGVSVKNNIRKSAVSPAREAKVIDKTAEEVLTNTGDKAEEQVRTAARTATHPVSLETQESSDNSGSGYVRTQRGSRMTGRPVKNGIAGARGVNGRNDARQEGDTSSRNDSHSSYRSEERSESSSSVTGRQESGESARYDNDYHIEPALEELDSGNMAHGILEVMQDGFGFIRCENYLPGDNDIYVSPAQIRRFNLKTGDIIDGNIKIKLPTEKFSALLFVKAVNGFHPTEASRRKNFEDMTPVFPNSRIRLETERASVPMRIVDLVSPIGKGQRGMIVAPPKTGKTTLLKQIAKSVHSNHPDMNMIILLIDERPEEVTDIKEYIEGDNVEVIYSTFDELPEHHKRVSEMVLERAKRLVEHKKDVVILLDSITRLARAYNLTVPPSGRTLSGGLDPAALHMPKKFFGAARNMREGGSLTVLATALVETGSKMDDVVFEEFKGTGNMELVLDRKLSEKRIFPAIDIARSGTRREELLLNREELEAAYLMRKALNGMKADEALERILEMFMRTKSNKDFISAIKKTKFI